MNSRETNVAQLVNNLLERLFPNFDNTHFQEEENRAHLDKIISLLINELGSFGIDVIGNNGTSLNSEKMVQIDLLSDALFEIKFTLSQPSTLTPAQLKESIINALLVNDIFTDKDVFASFSAQLNRMINREDKNAVSALVKRIYSQFKSSDPQKHLVQIQTLNGAFLFASENYVKSLTDKTSSLCTQLKLINSTFSLIIANIKKLLSQPDRSKNPISFQEIQNQVIEGLSCADNLLNLNKDVFDKFSEFLHQAIRKKHEMLPIQWIRTFLPENLLVSDTNNPLFFEHNKKQLDKIITNLMVIMDRLMSSVWHSDAHIIHTSLSELKNSLQNPISIPSYSQFRDSLELALLGGVHEEKINAQNSLYLFSEYHAIAQEVFDEKAKEEKKEARLETISFHTSNGLVEKIKIPYLDWRINPQDIGFNKNNPHDHVVWKNKVKNTLGGRDYDVYGGVIAEGGFGKVFLAKDIEKSPWLAVKVPIEVPENQKDIDDVYQELELLIKNKKNFVQFFDEKMFAIGMQLIKGRELWDIALSNTSFLTILRYHKDVTRKMRNIHSRKKFTIVDGERKTNKNELLNEFVVDNKDGTLHRDIKGGNIVVDAATYETEFLDFGLAKQDGKKQNDHSDLQVTDSAKGTLPYMAPEIYEGYLSLKKAIKDYKRKHGVTHIDPKKKKEICDLHQVRYTVETDIFAAGITFAANVNMVSSDPSDSSRFIITPLDQVLLEIGKTDRVNNEDKPELIRITTNLHALLTRMTSRLAKDRPDSASIAHQFDQFLNAMGKIWHPHICVISIENFIKLKEDQKELFVGSAKSKLFDAIVLQGTKETKYAAYYEARYQLMKDKKIFNVSPFMLCGENEEAILHLAKDHYDAELCTFNTKIFTYDNDKFVEKTAKVEILDVENNLTPKIFYPNVPSSTASTQSPISSANTSTLFGAPSSAVSSSQAENCNTEFLAFLKLIIMSESWKGKTLAKGKFDPREITGINKDWRPEDINQLRDLFNDNKFKNSMSDDERVIKINNQINIRKKHIDSKYIENGKADPRHDHVISLTASIGTTQDIKTRASITRLKDFVLKIGDKKLIEDCGLQLQPQPQSQQPQ